MKSNTGYVVYDKNKKRWLGRITFKDPVTGKRRWRKCYGQTKTEARNKLDRLKGKLRKNGTRAVAMELMTFADLARVYKEEKLIPAVYVGEKKIAGRRELSAPEAWLMQLRYHFGEMKLNSITKGDIEKFKIWISQVPKRSSIKEHEETGELILTRNEKGAQRSIEAVNRPIELLRTMLYYAEGEKMLSPEHNPFNTRNNGALIERKAENKRERLPTFGEEMALLEVCVDDRAHLRPAIIIASDTGLRQNEMLTLSWVEKDIDFDQRLIRLRAINAKGNKARTIPMTQRVYEELLKLHEKNCKHPSGLVFGGLKEVKRSFNTACRLTGIEDFHKHDLRHAFITRSILAGITPAVVLKASGHSSDEWKRYLNVTPDMLRDLLTPLAGQESESVKAHGVEVMRQLTAALMGSWKSVGNSEFFQDLWAKVAMPTGSGQRQAQMP